MSFWFNTTEKNIQRIFHRNNSRFDMLRRLIEVNGFNKMAFFHGYDDNVPTIIKHGKQSSRYNPVRDKARAPYQDHSTYFKNTKTGVCCLIYAPYYNADDIRKEVEEWAEKWGLKADVYDAEKCYYSKDTCLVVIHLPATNVIIP